MTFMYPFLNGKITPSSMDVVLCLCSVLFYKDKLDVLLSCLRELEVGKSRQGERNKGLEDALRYGMTC